MKSLRIALIGSRGIPARYGGYETLMEELASPDEQRVLYAIDVLESLDKRNLVTPLLLHHESSAVRVRALAALGSARPDIAQQWVPAIKGMACNKSCASADSVRQACQYICL